VCIYIYIYIILLRVISSLRGTLTIFDSFGRDIVTIERLGEHCQFCGNLRGVYGLSPKIKVI
jgi:hypothetical protein